ncbi:MAG: hypothetical protein AB1422_08315 [bacterium]
MAISLNGYHFLLRNILLTQHTLYSRFARIRMLPSLLPIITFMRLFSEFKRGKVYTKKCTQCDYRVAYAGIYTEYLVNYEDYEFLPVKIKSQGQ